MPLQLSFNTKNRIVASVEARKMTKEVADMFGMHQRKEEENGGRQATERLSLNSRVSSTWWKLTWKCSCMKPLSKV